MPQAANTQRVTFRSNKDVAIHVPDLGRAEEFYSKVLGFKIVSRGPNQIEFDTGAFHLWVNRDNSARSFIPSFDVSDYAEAKRHLKAAG
jgi:catechol 2,3-dioxygenase-like lactoylglutathione lyase family enzyme